MEPASSSATTGSSTTAAARRAPRSTADRAPTSRCTPGSCSSRPTTIWRSRSWSWWRAAARAMTPPSRWRSRSPTTTTATAPRSLVRRADLTQALTLAALVVLGLMTLFSTSRADFASQVGGVAAGLLLYVAAAAFDYRRLQPAAPYLYGLALLPHLLRGYQRQRLQIFLDPSQDPLGAGYNLIQARIAVGSGGIFGQGWLHGLQGQLGYIPERTSDFVFAVYAEEFGLLGSLLLLGLFTILLYRVARAAAVAPDRFGFLLCAGAAVILFTQVVQNIGMNVGLTPIAGIPLPFISHGRSALLTYLVMLGLVQSVVLRRPLVSPGPAGRVPLTESGTIRLPV